MKGLRVFLLPAGLLSICTSHKEGNPKDSSSTLKEGEVRVSGVKESGVEATLDLKTSTFATVLPTVTDFTSLGFVFTSDANIIHVGNQDLPASNTGIDLSSPLTVRLIKDGVYQDYTVQARNTGLPYTVRGQFVEFVLNGIFHGNYSLCELIKQNKKSVIMEKMDSMEMYPVKITERYLLEVDTNYDEPYKFRFGNLLNILWMVKEPDEKEQSPAVFEYIKNWMRDLETLINGSDRIRAYDYEEFLDVDTVIGYMIVEELT